MLLCTVDFSRNQKNFFVFYVNYFHIADSAREVEDFRLGEVLCTEPVSIRILFVLFPDYRRLQALFDSCPY